MRASPVFFALFMIALAACNQEDKTAKTTPKSADGRDTTRPKNFANKKMAGIKYFDYPIDEVLAQECADKFVDVYKDKYDEAMVKRAFTDFVAFDSKMVQDWLDTYHVLESSQY